MIEQSMNNENKTGTARSAVASYGACSDARYPPVGSMHNLRALKGKMAGCTVREERWGVWGTGKDSSRFHMPLAVSTEENGEKWKLSPSRVLALW